MTEKRVVREQRSGRVELHDEAAPELARGSASRVTAEQLTAISQPRTPSRAPLSAFQMPPERASAELPEPILPVATPSGNRGYLVVVIALLFCMVGVLGLLLVL